MPEIASANTASPVRTRFVKSNVEYAASKNPVEKHFPQRRVIRCQQFDGASMWASEAATRSFDRRQHDEPDVLIREAAHERIVQAVSLQQEHDRRDD